MEFSLAWPSIAQEFRRHRAFHVARRADRGDIGLSDFVAALVGDSSGLKVRLSGAPIKFAFDGTISSRPTLRMEGTLATDSASLRDTLRWAVRRTPPGGGFGRFALKAQTSVTGGNISLSAVNVELDGNVGEGALTFAAGGRQMIQGTLATEVLDLTPYMSTTRLLTSGDRSWERVPIVLDGLGGVDVDMRLSAARVAMGGARLGRTAVAANLRDGNFTVTVGESEAFGGLVRGSFGLAPASPAGANVKAQMQFSDVDLDQCLGELFGLRRLEGKGTLGFAIDSSGESVYGLTKALNGTATLTSRKGAIVGLNVEQLLQRLERSPLSGGNELRSGKTPYDQLAVNLKIVQGTVNVDDVHIEGPALRLGLGGSASIPARDLDLTGTAALLSAAAGAGSEPVAAFELPFVVRGPWDDPLMLPDPQNPDQTIRPGRAAPQRHQEPRAIARERRRRAGVARLPLPAPTGTRRSLLPASSIDYHSTGSESATDVPAAAGIRMIHGLVRTLVKVTVASLILGTILTHLGVTPAQLVKTVGLSQDRLLELARQGVTWALPNLLLGSLIIVPVWFLIYLFRPPGARSD